MPPQRLQLTIDMTFDPDGPSSQFDPLHAIMDALAGRNVTVGARLHDPAPPPAPASDPPVDANRPRRGRPRSGNGEDKPPAAAAPPEDVLLPPGSRAAPQDEGEDPELGMPVASGLTPAEAKEQALGLCRNIYAAGHKDTIADMRKKLGVTAFADVDPVTGHEFLKMAEAAAQKHGMRV